MTGMVDLLFNNDDDSDDYTDDNVAFGEDIDLFFSTRV